MLKQLATAVSFLTILAIAPLVAASTGDQVQESSQTQQQQDHETVELQPPYKPITITGQILLGALPLAVVPLGIEYSQTLGIESIWKAPIGGGLLAASAVTIPIVVEGVGRATGYANNQWATLLGALAGFTTGAFASIIIAGVNDDFGWHESPIQFVAPIAVGLLGGSILGFHIHAGSQYRIQEAKKARATLTVLPVTSPSNHETSIGFGLQGLF